jgi:hypothetical protein
VRKLRVSDAGEVGDTIEGGWGIKGKPDRSGLAIVGARAGQAPRRRGSGWREANSDEQMRRGGINNGDDGGG